MLTFEQRVADLQENCSMPWDQAAELAASERGGALCWICEWGAIDLPLGHPSRVTCFEAFNTLPEAVAHDSAGEFNRRIIPVFEPVAAEGQKPTPSGELSDASRLSLLNTLAKHHGFENATKALASIPLAAEGQREGAA